jgi:MSHA biogenesis protein MshP
MRRQRGFALVPAIFLIVVLAALGAVAIRVGSGQQQAVTVNLLQARALSAANAGIEWGAFSAIGAGVPGSCAASTTLALTEGALNGFTVVVTCSSTPIGTTGAYSYVINATATSGTYGMPSYVHRVVSATFSSPTA